MSIRGKMVRGDALVQRGSGPIQYSETFESHPGSGMKAEEYVETASEEIVIKKNPFKMKKSFHSWNSPDTGAEYEPEYDVE